MNALNPKLPALPLKRLLATLVLAAVTAAPAATNIVLNAYDGGAGSLRQTIQDSLSGDTINFDPGLSGAVITLTNGHLLLTNNLTIDASALPGGLQINGRHASRIFQAATNTTVMLTALTITNGYFSGVSPSYGGGILNSGTVITAQCTFTANTTELGGGIANFGTMTVNQCTFLTNTARQFGGGICNVGFMTLNQSILMGNSSSGDGAGGVYNFGKMTVNQSTLTANTTGSKGGGIYNVGNMTVNKSTLARNTCGSGGGIFNYGIGLTNATLTLNQCTLTGNSGGGILNDGPLTVNQSTITSNSWGFQGAGISQFQGSLSLFNSIVAGNSGSAPANMYISSSTTFTNTGINLTNGNPLLAPLGNYDGPTQTMPPLPCSPAIDAATNSLFVTDQRGFPIPLGLAPDIGAVEGVYNPAGPGALNNLTLLGDGSFRFAFTNFTDMAFTVMASTNASLPLKLWSNLGAAVETPVGSGQFRFTDPEATNTPQRFYRVRMP